MLNYEVKPAYNVLYIRCTFKMHRKPKKGWAKTALPVGAVFIFVALYVWFLKTSMPSVGVVKTIRRIDNSDLLTQHQAEEIENEAITQEAEEVQIGGDDMETDIPETEAPRKKRNKRKKKTPMPEINDESSNINEDDHEHEQHYSSYNITGQYDNTLIDDEQSSFFESDHDYWSDKEELVDLLKRYSYFHNKHVTSTTTAVVVRPIGQLCNRLMAIISGFFFALLTKKVMVFEDSGFYCSMHDLFKEPGFKWTAKASNSHNTRNIKNPNHPPWSETEPLLCGNLSNIYTGGVYLNMNQYSVPYPSWNPHYRGAVKKLFPKGDVFTPLARFLFRPTNDLLSQKEKYIEDNFKGKTIIGMQVRSGQDFTSSFMTKKDWKLYEACGLSDVAPDTPEDDIRYFIATDTEKGREEAKKHLGEDKVIFGPGPFLRSNNPVGVQMALLDVLLLSESTELITTAWSSFGYMAAGLRGKPKKIVSDFNPKGHLPVSLSEEQFFMGIPHKSEKRLKCVTPSSHQPCFHKFANWGSRQSSCFVPEMTTQEMLSDRYC